MKKFLVGNLILFSILLIGFLICQKFDSSRGLIEITRINNFAFALHDIFVMITGTIFGILCANTENMKSIVRDLMFIAIIVTGMAIWKSFDFMFGIVEIFKANDAFMIHDLIWMGTGVVAGFLVSLHEQNRLIVDGE